MPQIDLVAYLAQYVWTLISLLLLYACVVLKILPRIQQQLALRAQAEVIYKDLIVPVEGDIKSGSVTIFKPLLNLDLN